MSETESIRRWMRRHLEEYTDPAGEVNSTALAEAWDQAESTGEATLDPDHPAWDVAAELAIEAEDADGEDA